MDVLRKPNPSRRSAFTLIELLLVVVISLLAAALAVPSFVRSFRGAKLRTSARTVVMGHRYARGMAVLRQVPVAVLYDAEKGEMEIVSVPAAARVNRDAFLDDRAARVGVDAVDHAPAEEDAEGNPAPPAGGVATEMVRRLAEGVRIASFDSDRVEREVNGVYWVNYYPNGMCDPYTIRLRDAYGQGAEVSIDPLSGKAEVDYE